MTHKKVQISDILGNLIPNFIEADNPKFRDFLDQYYVSEEHTYGTTYLADNLNDFKNITTLNEVSKVEEQILPPPESLYPTKPIIVAVDTLAYDSTIYLCHSDTTVTPAQALTIPVEGFPDTYGLIKIDDEIITYTNQTFDPSTGLTAFSGCVRGFSGVSELESAGNPEYLTFIDTNGAPHEAGTIVLNLNFLFLNKFYEKHKQQFLPGLEKRLFKQGISAENILTRARDFYSSKGTDTSLKILFNVLYGEEVDVVKPFNETIIPSGANWSITEDMIVEAIEGNPLNLIGTKLYQGDEVSPTASGSAENVQQVFLENKSYYRISFVKGSVMNEKYPGRVPEFVVNSKTQLIERLNDKSVMTVDSTVGFPDKGILYYLDPFSKYTKYSTVAYGAKSYNQFFDCVGIGSLPLVDGDISALDTPITILSGNFLYGYEDNNLNKLCEMRIVGSVAGISADVSKTKYFNVNDTIGVKYLGEKTDINDPKFNKWFYNNVTENDISNLEKADPNDTTSDTIVTPVNHFLHVGDRIDIYKISDNSRTKENVEVTSIDSDTKFKISQTVVVGPQYKFRKRLDYIDVGFGVTSLLGNIQNTFVDSEENTYLAFSGFPGFDTSTDNGSKTFTSSGVSTETSVITIPSHQFRNGEQVYYKAPITGITTLGETGIDVYTIASRMNQTGYGSTFADGYYFVKKIDDNSIKLCVDSARIITGDPELIKYTGVSANAVHTLIPAKINQSGGLKDQKNFKRILKTPKNKETVSDVTGPIGVTLNGVELHSPISGDSIFYGPIQDIIVTSSGRNYDVVNPPSVSITDSVGSGAEIYPSFSGSLSEVVLLTPGHDYVDTPVVSIVGGNGSGAILQPKVRAYTHSLSVSDSSFILDVNKVLMPTDTFTGKRLEHKFLDGEAVTYTPTGNPIGIGTIGVNNVGFTTDVLSKSSVYYIAKHDNHSFSLAITKDRALTKTKLINFKTRANKGHIFTATKIRRILDDILVIEPGSSYTNRTVSVNSVSYPPTSPNDLITTFSGISTQRNSIYAKKHGFETGDVVEYSHTGTSISGINSVTQYKVTKLSDNDFKLSDIGSDKNLAVSFEFRRTARLVSHTYVSGATSWQQVDNSATDNGFVGIWLRNLRPGSKYRISLRVDNNAALDSGSFDHRVHPLNNNPARTNFTDWDGTNTGLLTAEFIATTENDDEFLFYANAITVNVSDFEVKLVSVVEDYKRNIFTNITGIGTGKHIFKDPEIKVKIDGIVSAGSTSKVQSFYNATAYPVITGGIDNVYVGSGGTSYGVEDVLNYAKQPIINILTGEGASMIPIIDSGKIVDVLITNKGKEYTTAPTLQVVGTGTTQGFAQLQANVSDGKIVSVDILNPGKNYVRNETEIRIIPVGKGAKFHANVHEWKFNAVQFYDNSLSNSSLDSMVQITSPQLYKGTKVCSFYPSKKYRRILGDNIGPSPSYSEDYLEHGKLIGWAYDGNPIFGPIGSNSVGTGVTWMQSSYDISLVTTPGIRPSTSKWVSGSFIQDYSYRQSGDLDEFNGKYIKPGELGDFPNGTYAYFSTIDLITKEPSFPYITFKHHNETDQFNNDTIRDQSDKYINTGDYKRNVTHLGLNERFIHYPFLADALKSKVELKVDSVSKSNVSKILVNESGVKYNVGDIVNFNDGRINAKVSEVLGSEVVSIATTESSLSGVKFAFLDGIVTGLSTIPHGLEDGDNIQISGISSTLYKNLEGNHIVGVTTVSSTVSSQIPNQATDTDISLTASTRSERFAVGDIIKINAEEMLITNLDDINNKYRVRRAYNSTSATAHSVNVVVTKLPQIFTFEVDEKLENANFEYGPSQYFAPSQSVGIGTTYSSVVVGTAGSSNISRSIPPKAIYIPGHEFNTGDPVTLVGYGSTIWGSSSVGLGNTFKLEDFSKLYSIKINDEYVGLATIKNYVGLSTGGVYFAGIEVPHGDNSKLEVIVDNINGTFTKINSTVTVATATTSGSQHSLLVGDKVTVNVTPQKTEYASFAYNGSIRRLVVNPVSIASTVDNTAEAIASGTNGISTSQDAFIIPNHDFETGDSIVYTTSGTTASPLRSNNVYYVINDSKNTIKLAKNRYDLKMFPYKNISIGSSGTGSHQIAKVNPRLEVYSGNTIAIGVSDPSLSGYDINFYNDATFLSRFESSKINKVGAIGDGVSGTQINVSVASSDTDGIYYRIEGIGNNFMDTYPSSVDTDIPNFASISILDSKFNTTHRVSGIGSTTFAFTLVGSAETTSYTSNGFSTAFYSTNSKLVKGGVHSIELISSPDNLSELPILTSVGSTTGSGVVFSIESDNIGRVNSVTVPYQGLEFPKDNTLQPKADSNLILNLKNTLTLSNVGVTTGGRNYTNPPNAVGINNSSIALRSNLKAGSVNSVDILSNDTGLSEDLEIVATNNSNGVAIANATSDFNSIRNQHENTIFIKVPPTYTGFSTATFPFQVGGKVLVENVDIVGGANSTASGYNSSGYGYKLFTVVGINTQSSQESVTYSIQGIGNTGGAYDATNEFGRIIREEDLAKYTPIFENVKFYEGELVKSTSGATGNVSVGGWNSDTKILKLYNVQGDFKPNDSITGTISNSKSSVTSSYVSDLDLSVSGIVESTNDWTTNTGKLNLDDQRIHDSDYYQRFSYAIKGDVPYLTWKDSVDSLDHVSGFKNFANLGITSSVLARVEQDGSLDVRIELASESTLWERWWFDYVTEQTTNKKFSKIIKFENKVITDYNESVTNKVLTINDISSEFSGKTSTFTGEHKFVRASTGGISKTSGGTLSATTGTEYDPITGILTIVTTSNHGLTSGNTITISDNSMTFNCSKDNYSTEHTYPRSSDPASTSNTLLNNGILPITKVSDTKFTVVINTPITGGKNVGLSTFTINTNIGGITTSLLHHEFNPSAIDVSDIEKHKFTINEHYFNTGETIIYNPKVGVAATVGIVTTTVAGIGATDILPPTLYAIRDDNNTFRVAVSKANANAGTGVTFTDLAGVPVTSTGTVPAYGGNGHTFSVPSADATARSLILIDNMIQSPLSNKTIPLELSAAVGIGSTQVYVEDATKLKGRSLVKINDELIQINTVGIGSTTTLEVTRGVMGTQIGVHTVGAGITAISGDYRIEKGKIYFNAPPYGPSGINSTTSSFRGRIFYRLDYTDNYIIDDASEAFTGSVSEFTLKSNKVNLPIGVSSYFGMVLINNIFQRPWYADLGAETDNDYNVGTGLTITFTGSAANGDLPRGGVINEFSVGIGSGYQIPTKAIATPVVSAAGTIASVAINTAGQGYISSPRVSIGVTYANYTHQFESALNGAVNVQGAGTQLTPTYAEYDSATGNLVLIIPNHGLTTSNSITLDNNSLTFRCSRDAFATGHSYPRSTDPASTSNGELSNGVLPIIETSTNSIKVFIGRGAGTGATFNAHINAGIVTGITVTNPGSGYTTSDMPIITVDQPSPYVNIPLTGGSGSNASMDVVVGTGGSVLSFAINNRGIGYEIGDNLQLYGLPVKVGIGTSAFNITVKNEYTDKFAAWNFGKFLEMDDFSNLFNGYRKVFLITRTVTNKEYYSIDKREGSGIVLANNLLLFINDVLQIPGEDYIFDKGTKIEFREAPKPGSKFKFYLYTGSDQDVNEVNVDESVKPGDLLQIQTGINTITKLNIDNTEQESRTIHELIASDLVNTNTYFGVGIKTTGESSDPGFIRPVRWTKQREDKILDGLIVSKERDYLEPKIYPTTMVIKTVQSGDTKIYVEDTYAFDSVDATTGSVLNDVNLIGLSTVTMESWTGRSPYSLADSSTLRYTLESTRTVDDVDTSPRSQIELLQDATYAGDYGHVIGITTHTSGVGTATPSIRFTIKPHPDIFKLNSPTSKQRNVSGITTGDYFVIRNSLVGNISGGTTSLNTGVNDVVSIGNSFIDNVYYANHWVSAGSSTITVHCNVNSLSGITTAGIATVPVMATYSWGTINVGSRPVDGKTFETNVIGFSSAPKATRNLQMMLVTDDIR